MTPKQQQVELKSGEVYRGTLVEAEDNWNCQLTNVSLTGRDGALFFCKRDRCGRRRRRALRSHVVEDDSLFPSSSSSSSSLSFESHSVVVVVVVVVIILLLSRFCLSSSLWYSDRRRRDTHSSLFSLPRRNKTRNIIETTQANTRRWKTVTCAGRRYAWSSSRIC